MRPKTSYKIIRHLPSGINLLEDLSLSLPFLVEVNFSPPELMTFFEFYGGRPRASENHASEEIVVRCADRQAVDRFILEAELQGHPRLRWIKLTGPNGVSEDITHTKAAV